MLLFSKAAVRSVYHRQYEHIAEHEAISELLVVVPPFWCEPRVGRLPLEQVHPERYWLEVTPLRWNGRYHVYYAPYLPSILRRFQPDVVHIDEEVYNFATFHAALAARRHGARSVAFCWQNIYRRYPPPFRWFEVALARCLSGAVAGNADAKEVLRRKGFRLPIVVIPQYGVDTNLFTPSVRPASPPFRVGFLGRLVPAKGIDTLLESLQYLPEECEAWIAGEGDQRRWQVVAEEMGVAMRVRWIGAVPSGQVPNLMHQLHVLALPSRTTPRWKEQFGRVLVEAMACGVPVIGSDSGEIPRVVGTGGLVFPEGEARQLAACIRRLLDDPLLRQGLSEKARQRACQHFSMEHVAGEYVRFWQSTCRVDAVNREGV